MGRQGDEEIWGLERCAVSDRCSLCTRSGPNPHLNAFAELS